MNEADEEVLFPVMEYLSLASSQEDSISWRVYQVKGFKRRFLEAKQASPVDAHVAADEDQYRLRQELERTQVAIGQRIQNANLDVPVDVMPLWISLILCLAPDHLSNVPNRNSGRATIAEEVVAFVYVSLFMRCPDTVAHFLSPNNFFHSFFRDWVRDPHNPYVWCAAMLRALENGREAIRDPGFLFSLQLDFSYPCIWTLPNSNRMPSDSFVNLLRQPTLTLLCINFLGTATLGANPHEKVITKYAFMSANKKVGDESDDTLSEGNAGNLEKRVKKLNAAILTDIPTCLFMK
jgi:hypothetical protein